MRAHAIHIFITCLEDLSWKMLLKTPVNFGSGHPLE